MFTEQEMDGKISKQLERKVPPFVWTTIFNFAISVLVFYGHIGLAFRLGSIVYSVYQMSNLAYELLTEKIVLASKDNTWISKFTYPERLTIKIKNNRDVEMATLSSGTLSDGIKILESQSLNKNSYEYSYKVRIPSPLCKNSNLIKTYLFIPLFKVGLLREPFLYKKELVEYVVRNL